MLTKEIVLALKYGNILYHVSAKNADGTPLRARVNGKCKDWKRDPAKFQLPMKHGLKDCFYIKYGDMNDWAISETAAIVEGP